MREKRVWLALPVAAALMLSGCAAPAVEATPTPAPTLTATAPPDQVEERDRLTLACRSGESFHPITGDDRLNMTLTPLVYQGLFRLDEHFRPQQELCAGYTVSDDFLRWSFELGGATFSDGMPMTAADVVASLELARRSDRYTPRLADVTTIRAEGETVVVTLRRANSALPALLDIPVVRNSGDPLRPLGTGAYVLEERLDQLCLVRREKLGDGLDVIPLRPVAGAEELVNAFDAGEITLVDTDLTGVSVLGYAAARESRDYSTATLLYLGCNTRSGVLADQGLRQALALAVDRKGVVGRALEGHAVAAALPVHPDSVYYDNALARRWSYDTETAAQKLAEAGWSREQEEGPLVRRGAQLALRLIVNQDNLFKVTAAQMIAGDLEALGCVVTLDVLPWGEFTRALDRGQFDLYLAETTLTPDFDLAPLLTSGGAVNRGGFSNAQVDTLLAQSRRETGEEQVTTFVNLCGAVVEHSPIIPVCFKNGSVIAQWGQLEGLRPTQRNVFAGLVGEGPS